MLRGERVGLRTRRESDVAVLHEELLGDVVGRSRAASSAWRPIPSGSDASPYRVEGPSDDRAVFSVVDLADDSLAGDGLLWGIDLHNRLAHLGMTLRPAYRGRGLGTDVVRVLCRYGFATLGLHRLQIETLADNDAMIRAAERAGFRHDGTLRSAAWVDGEFLDDVVYGLLAADWAV